MMASVSEVSEQQLSDRITAYGIGWGAQGLADSLSKTDLPETEGLRVKLACELLGMAARLLEAIKPDMTSREGGTD